MRRRLTITGSTLLNCDPCFKAQLAAEIEKNVWQLLENKKIKPVIDKEFPLAEVSSAHRLMKAADILVRLFWLAEIHIL